jgi:hypothetical protein
MSFNPSQPIRLLDRLRDVAAEQSVGGHFEGESQRERKVGHTREVIVDIFKREANLADLGRAGTYFMRVSLRSAVDSKIIYRHEIDISANTNERELTKMAMIAGGALAEEDCEKRGANWDIGRVAQAAEEAAKELLAEISKGE